MRQSIIAATLSIALLLFSTPLYAGDWTDTDVFVDADETAAMIDDGAAVVDAREQADFQRGHIPGAAHLHWQQFVEGQTSGALIDDDARLVELLETAGISSDRPVIVYGAWDDDGWGEEGRIYWTLEYLGHDDVHLLVGGLTGWNRAGQPIAAGSAQDHRRGSFDVQRQQQHRATTQQLQSWLQNGHSTAVLDTRDREEFEGTAKYGERRGGHIPDAQHLWWHDLLDDDGSLLDTDAIDAKLHQLGIGADDTIVAYCTGGVRSGFVYAVLRARGFEDVRNYDASMWDWTRDDDAPVERIHERGTL